MSRLSLAIVWSFAALGFCAYSVVTTWVYPTNAPLKGVCDAWLERPVSRWLSLSGCVLDVDLVVIESDQGDFETLANRQRGLSMKPYPESPNWVAAWIPVRTQSASSGTVRAVYRLESPDLMKWINELERADGQKKDRMWADPSLVRRLSRPGVLTGRGDKSTNEGVRKAFGSAAAANMFVVLAGEPPPASMPTAGILSGLLGLVLLGYATRLRSIQQATAEQQITGLSVSDVKLEIGALEELRREELSSRRKTKIH